MSSTTNTVLITLIVGVAVGAALGLLLAPASGKETREKLMKKSGKIRDTVADMVDDARKMAGEAVADKANQAASDKAYGSQQRGTAAGSGARV